MRSFVRSPLGQRILSGLIAGYIHLVFRTKRWRVEGEDAANALLAAGRPFIGCFWHSRMLMMTEIWARRAALAMLISPHQDGQLIAKTISRLGVPTIAGSTARGGSEALVTIVRTLKAGTCVAITPDGPTGPRMRAAGGVVAAARVAGVAIVPVAYSCTNALTLGTWDRLLLPLPFGRGLVMVGAPITIPPGTDAEAREMLRREVEDQLNALTRECDRRCGRAPVEPAPAKPDGQ